jgi:hypothetical protein
MHLHIVKMYKDKESNMSRICLWRPCLLTDRDEMSNLYTYRGPSIDASYQVSVHLAERFQRRRFLKTRPIRNKNCLWQPCLLMDRDEMSNLYRGPSIDASYQISDQLALRFQRRRLKCEKLADNRQFLFLIGWFLKNLLLLFRLCRKNYKRCIFI